MTRFEAFVDDVVRALPADRRLVARRELLDHLRSAFDAARRDAVDDATAAELAIAELGDARRLRRRLWIADWKRSLEAARWPALFVMAFAIVAPSLAILEWFELRHWIGWILAFTNVTVAWAYWAGLVATRRMTWADVNRLSVGAGIAWLSQWVSIWIAETPLAAIGVGFDARQEAFARVLSALVIFAWTLLALYLLGRFGGRRLAGVERVGIAIGWAAVFSGMIGSGFPADADPADLRAWAVVLMGVNAMFWLVLAVRVAPIRDEWAVVAAR
jgi:hypothetical protein